MGKSYLDESYRVPQEKVRSESYLECKVAFVFFT